MGQLPDALDRREILYSKPKRRPDFATLGDDYAAAGNLSDAVECYERLEAAARDAKLQPLRKQALASGDHFILNRIDGHLPLETSEWSEAARNAQKAGQLRYALKSAQRAEDVPLLEELRTALGIPQPGAESQGYVDYLVSGEGSVAEATADEGSDEGPPPEPEGDGPVG